MAARSSKSIGRDQSSGAGAKRLLLKDRAGENGILFRGVIRPTGAKNDEMTAFKSDGQTQSLYYSSIAPNYTCTL